MVLSGSALKAVKMPGGGNEVRVFQSFVDGSNWIMFQNGNTGELVGRQQVSKTVDYRCTLRFQTDASSPAGGPLIYFDVINDDGSTQEAITNIRNELYQWIAVPAGVLAAIIKKYWACPDS
jgi:hypothetical protein